MQQKRERIRLLVTATIWHDGTRADRRDAIADTRECLTCTRNVKRAEPKRVTLLGDDMVIVPRLVWKLAASRQKRCISRATDSPVT